MGKSIAIFKNCFHTDSEIEVINANLYSNEEIAGAIKDTVNMTTINSITKQELQNAIKWILDTYFEEIGG